MRHAILTASLMLGAAFCACASSNRSGNPEPTAKNSSATTKQSADAGGMMASDACGWPARLDRGDDAPRGACHAKRHLLSCSAGGGATETCTSDDTTCSPNAGESACDDQCKAGEYAIGCGAIGPDTGMPDPPPNCHDQRISPGGTFFMCCPCE